MYIDIYTEVHKSIYHPPSKKKLKEAVACFTAYCRYVC